MPKFSANLSMLFTEVPLLDRFALAAKAGFQAVEFLFPYDHPPTEIRRRLDDHGLQLVLHNLPAGDWNQGERGIACLPERSAEFRAGVTQAIDYALALGVPQLNCLAGKAPKHLADVVLHTTLLENLRYAALALQEVNVRLLIEPINTFDIPQFYINTTAKGLRMVEEVRVPNVYLQYDVYHAQRMEGELAKTLEAHMDRISHIQIADNPGRHEPGSGEINYAFLLPHIDRLGYSGWIGCEYKPAAQTEAGLAWRQRWSA